MIKSIITGFSIVSIIGIVSAIVAWFIVPELFDTKYITTREAIVDGDGIRIVSDGKFVYEQNIKSQEYKKLRYELSTPKSIVNLNGGMIQPGYEFMKDYPKVINPSSMGLKEDIPYTFKSSISESSDYIASLEAEDWVRYASFCDSNYCDIYYKIDSETLRLVVSETFIKIFPSVTGNINTPQTYINEDR